MSTPKTWLCKDLPLSVDQLKEVENLLVETTSSQNRINTIEKHIKRVMLENSHTELAFSARGLACPIDASDETYDGHRALFSTASRCRDNRTIRMLSTYLLEEIFPKMDPAVFKGVYALGTYDTWFTYPQLFMAFGTLSKQQSTFRQILDAYLPDWKNEIQALWLKEDNVLMMFNGMDNIFDCAEPWLFLRNDINVIERASLKHIKTLLNFAKVHDINSDAADLIAERITNSQADLTWVLNVYVHQLCDNVFIREGLKRIRNTLLKQHANTTLTHAGTMKSAAPAPSL